MKLHLGVGNEVGLVTRLAETSYLVCIERAVLIKIAAQDVNCPQHIPRTIDIEDATAAIEKLESRILTPHAKKAPWSANDNPPRRSRCREPRPDAPGETGRAAPLPDLLGQRAVEIHAEIVLAPDGRDVPQPDRRKSARISDRLAS